MSSESKAGADRLGGLDLLRFALCVVVVVIHYFRMGPEMVDMPGVPYFSWSGVPYLKYAVQSFFLVSGFALMYTIRGRSAVAFLITRTSRMWPALAVCATVTYLATRGYDQGPGFMQLVQSVTVYPLGTGISAGVDWSYWTMTFELRFYLLVLIAMMFVDLRAHRVALIAGWIVLSLAHIFLLDFGYDVPFLKFIALDYYSGGFIIGALTHVMWSEKGAKRWVSACLMIAAFVLSSRQMFFENTAYPLRHWLEIPNAEIATWFVPPILWALLMCSLLIQKPFEIPWVGNAAKFLGALTYPLYLVHQMFGYRVMGLVAPHLSPEFGIVAPLSALALSLAVAVFVAAWWEPWVRPKLNRWGFAAADWVARFRRPRTA